MVQPFSNRNGSDLDSGKVLTVTLLALGVLPPPLFEYDNFLTLKMAEDFRRNFGAGHFGLTHVGLILTFDKQHFAQIDRGPNFGAITVINLDDFAFGDDQLAASGIYNGVSHEPVLKNKTKINL
jgi:hypothetical protein